MFLIMGILASLIKAAKTGVGEIVDSAIIDGTTSMMGIVHSLHSLWVSGPINGNPIYWMVQCLFTAAMKQRIKSIWQWVAWKQSFLT